ncbi:hypothetical protein Taro_023295, partial [Colocasia esculenta]|nr:hypothetical protein [Colocasia esculenta]
VRACLSLARLVACYKPAVRRGFVVLPRLFARCLALEGLSRSDVVSISWDPRPWEPVEGVLRATSVIELAAHVWDAEGFRVLSWRRPDSPLSHCLSLCWFRSHVVVLGVGPQLGQAVVLCALCVSVAALSHPFARAEAGARLASRACGLRVPLLAASGGGLVAVVVTAFSSRCFQVFLVARSCTVVIAWLCLVSTSIVGLALVRPVLLVVPASVFSQFRGPVLGCQPVMALACVASRPGSVRGPGCAEHCFRFVPDSVGFCGSRVPARDGTGVCSFPTWRCPGSRVVLLVGPRPCRGLRWPCLRCAEHCFRFMPDSVGFCGSRCVPRPWLVVMALYCSLPLLSSTML